MRTSPRLLPSDLEPGERRVYVSAAVFFCVVLVALVWPVYAFFADIRPRVLGMPLSLVWVVGWVVASFLGLLAVYLWEGRRRGGGSPGGGPGRRGSAGSREGTREGGGAGEGGGASSAGGAG